MSFTFVVLRQSGQRYDRAPLTADDSELSLSNENAHDVLDALGIEDPYSSSPWPIAPFRALLTATRRKRLGHQSAGLCHGNLILVPGNPEAGVRSQAAVAARHVRKASVRRARSVWRDVRWRWTLKVLWTAA